MKIAYTGWTWLVNHKDNYKYEFEQSLWAAADLGYDAVENFAFITKYYDNDANEVKALLDKYGLEMANLYLHFSENPEEDYQNAVNYLDFMKKIGATYMNMQAVMWNDEPHNRPTDEKAILAYAELSNKIGKLCAEQGCIACFHPHANTAVYTEEQIDLFLANTDPAYVKLCPDTAHTTLAGMDAVKAFEKYASRIGYVHLKDVDPDVNFDPKWPMNRFRALGMGTVDFRGVVNALKNAGYDGVLCVELDKPHVCNYRSAQISREYIHNVLGM
ncbi:sugar phosphate isomerase/epimerase [Eubacteriales bacterium OttesenSCG-928-N13]|nr:sugar phosphate isomerase/epimerase [Eubacteriales bacterium OttesenSCG-928-N13]